MHKSYKRHVTSFQKGVLQMKHVHIMLAALSVLAAAETRAEIRTSLSARYGATLMYKERMLSRAMRFQVASPDWKTRHVRAGDARFRRVVTRTGGSFSGETPEVRLNFINIKCTGNSVAMALDAEYRGEKPAIYEFMPFAIPAAMFRNGAVRVEMPPNVAGSGTTKLAETDKFNPGEVVKAVFSAAGVGSITVESSDGRPFRILDRRLNRYGSDPEEFIIMRSGKLAPGAKMTAAFNLTFEPAAAHDIEKISTPPAPVVTAERTFAESRFPLLPQPKCIKVASEQSFIAKRGTVAVVKGGDGEGRLLRHARRILGAYGIEVRAGDAPPEHGVFIEVGEGIPESPEGYLLRITPKGVTIRSATERGAFYGLQTLRVARGKEGPFRALEIRDWPDFKFRGLHTKSNSGTFQLYSQILEKVAAPLKLNAFMLECQYVRWDTLGGAKHPRGMSKEDFVRLARVAHENYIDFIPLQQTLSHNQWLFANGRNLELAEDPDANGVPYNYNPSDPRVYQLLEKVFDELIAASGTPYLHIGHDEIDDWGRVRFPHRPENVKLGAKELFRRDVMWHHDYAKRKNVKLMLWHDALLAKSEPGTAVAGAIGGTETLRKELPRDLVICVWSYRPRNKYREIDYFLKDGYPVIGCTWEHTPGSDRGNIGRFTRYCLDKPGVLGMLETTWSHFGTETMLNSHFFQATACVTAAANFWNSKAGLNRKSAEKVFVDLMGFVSQPYKMRFTSIPFAGNTVLDDQPFGFDNLAPVMNSRGGIRFPIMKAGAHTAALTGRAGEKLTIDLGGIRCDELYLLGTLLEEPVARGVKLGRVSVEYADGGSAEFFLRSPAATPSFQGAPHFTDPDGKTSQELHEIFTPDAETGYANRASVCMNWRDGFKRNYKLQPTVWKNPQPDKPLRKLVLSEFNSIYPWYLLGLAAGSRME